MDLPSSGDVALTRGLAGDLPQSKEHLLKLGIHMDSSAVFIK